MNLSCKSLLLLSCLCAGSVMADDMPDGHDGAPGSAQGAAHVPEPLTVQAPPKSLPAVELTPQILYQVLLAEIAGDRGNIGLMVEAYRDLARTTRDPRIAQRSAQIALFARRSEVALESARLWAELEPDSAQARQLVTKLLATGMRPEELVEHIRRQLAAEGSNRPAALLQINRALANIQDKRQVQRLVDQVTTPYIGVAEAHFARAAAALGAQDNVRALAEAERAAELRPEWEQALMLRAQLLPRREAIEVLRRFMQSQTASREVRRLLARIHFNEKNYAEAREEFSQILKETPDDGDTLYAVGVLSFQLRELAEAERNFRRLVDLKYVEGDSVRLYLGQIAEDEKRWSEALNWYGGIGAGEQYLAARLRQAGVLVRQEGLDAGLRHLREARAAAPAGNESEMDAKLLIGEAQLLREAGRLADALALLDKSLQAQPNQPDLLYESALLAERIGRFDVLDSRLKRLIELKPNHAHAYNALGYSLVERQGNLEEAQKLIDKALTLAPDDPFILDSRGWVQFRRGDAAGALETLRRAYALRSDPEIAAHLGEVLWSLGEKDEAARTWREAAKAHPEHDVLTATIKRLQP